MKKPYNYRRERIEAIEACKERLAYCEERVRQSPQDACARHFLVVAKAALRSAQA